METGLNRTAFWNSVDVKNELPGLRLVYRHLRCFAPSNSAVERLFPRIKLTKIDLRMRLDNKALEAIAIKHYMKNNK